jgi:hypothetical protein
MKCVSILIKLLGSHIVYVAWVVPTYKTLLVGIKDQLYSCLNANMHIKTDYMMNRHKGAIMNTDWKWKINVKLFEASAPSQDIHL